uniref:MFS transporter n=1 Tax=Picea glauca TaxID=3330 RepID=A0A101LTY7_PICGL|nr:hypothetical protein ABT39_MTgene3519 [Picea glauca]
MFLYTIYFILNSMDGGLLADLADWIRFFPLME